MISALTITTTMASRRALIDRESAALGSYPRSYLGAGGLILTMPPRDTNVLWTSRGARGLLTGVFDTSLITQGAHATGAALTLNRVAVGVFFAISGYHKLFNTSRHATLRLTLQDDGVHAVPVMQWLIPSAEFGGGCALIVGFLSVFAALGLFAICAGALGLDALKRVRAWKPIDRADWLGDVLYLPEALYSIALAIVMLAGPGPWSLDAALASLFTG